MATIETNEETTARWAREKQEKIEAIDALTAGVAKHLEAWTVKPRYPDEENDEYRRGILVSGAMAIHLSIDWQKKRVNVATWEWPEYFTTERGERRGHRITPNDLYDPREASPSISVSLTRSHEAIATDIARRFIPEYVRIFARCADKARASQEYADRAESGWAKICALVGKEDKKDRGTVYADIGPFKGVTVENRNGNAHVQMDLSPERFAALVAALGGGEL